jgi:hypothetical protein
MVLYHIENQVNQRLSSSGVCFEFDPEQARSPPIIAKEGFLLAASLLVSSKRGPEVVERLMSPPMTKERGSFNLLGIVEKRC